MLRKVQGETVVDYDIEAYADRLDEIMKEKIQIFQGILDQVNKVRHCIEEEENVYKKKSLERGGLKF